MLKATMNSKYRKPSGWQFTYSVTGPIAEVEEYVAIQSAAANKTPDQWSRTPAGHPLFYIPLNNLLRNGDTPQPSYNLIKSHDGLRFFTDTTAQDMARYQRVAAASEAEEGKLMAQVRLGIITIGQQNRTALPVPATNAPAIAAPADAIEDLIGNQLGSEDNAGEQAEPALTGAGTETLGG